MVKLYHMTRNQKGKNIYNYSNYVTFQHVVDYYRANGSYVFACFFRPV